MDSLSFKEAVALVLMGYDKPFILDERRARFDDALAKAFSMFRTKYPHG